ncbi:hypothetical protein [Acidiluteibacter ferrifornacis]|uniref:Uncharacterized protein n=1 Tax=Acidiluteibacter ferrifornacis TaxID=2692424 RepID=A0A6N9NGH2_9FLAO|nr:hypothetical protein [Acidiluteibacter ferrifornacis]NBG65738.1 hypothetical protein [Acidiluteibacter ferrifornacis]
MRISILILQLFLIQLLIGQNQNPFNGYLPMMKTSSLNWASAMNKNETILFEAQPTIYYQIYNQYRQDSLAKKQALYVYFQSHFRMYNEESLPVKTPSYMGFIGWQKSYNWVRKSQFTWLLETGHYSNGQSRSTWNEQFEDGSDSSEAAYRAINNESNLSQLLNRSTGNFSVNLSRIRFQYVIPQKREQENRVLLHKIALEYLRYHAAFAMLIDYTDGISDVEIIGENQFQLEYESVFETVNRSRLTFNQECTYLAGSHPSINPIRLKSTISFFPKDWVTGFFVSYIHGHDNYNYRIVDSRNQVQLGIHFDFYNLRQHRL